MHAVEIKTARTRRKGNERGRENETERERERERERECIVVQFPERSSGVEFSTFLLLKTDVQIKYLEESGDEGRWD